MAKTKSCIRDIPEATFRVVVFLKGSSSAPLSFTVDEIRDHLMTGGSLYLILKGVLVASFHNDVYGWARG